MSKKSTTTPAPAPQAQPQAQTAAQAQQTPTVAPPVPPAQPQTTASTQPQAQQTPSKSYLTPFWLWVIVCACSILLLSVGVLCTEEEPSDTSTTIETVYIPIHDGKGTKVDANLLSAKFAKFQQAVLDWNNVSGDSWRWDSWDRARQGAALAAYARAYSNLYVEHGIDAGREARILWVYATCMIRISKAENISYAEALDRIATKNVTELVRMLNKSTLSPAQVKEINRFF